jgi:diguanylate cyclase (GGDEF)-like protein
MLENKKKLQVISNETKGSINQISVVTPSMYASIFAKFAQEHNTTIENEKELASELIIDECSNLTNLQIQTAKNAQQLSSNTNKAISAIKDKNDLLLYEVLEETEELRKEIEKLKESVYKDELTNTLNRKWLHDNILNKEAQSFKDSGTLVMIDLNYFKIINDTYGHIIGDKVLVFIANQLKKSKVPVIRYGGDEFIIIFPSQTTYKSTVLKLNKIRDSILKKHLQVKDATFRVSFSIGIQEFQAGDNLTQTIEKADKDMYKDKIKIKKVVTSI